MTESNEKRLEENKFKNLGINWLGKVDDFYFSVQDKQDSEDELIVSFTFAQNSNKSTLFAYFDELQKAEKISEYSLESEKITVIYRENNEDSISDFLETLSAKIKEINGTCICENCDSTENLSYYTNGSVFSLLCERCGSDVIQKFERDKQKATNYTIGFFASLVGALIGSVAWIVIGALGFFASIAGLAISYCAFKGYEMVGSKVTRKGILLTVLAIIIGFLFAQYAVLFIEFMKEYPDMTMQGFLEATPYLLSDSEFLIALLPNFGLGILFAFLGTYRMIINNYKSAKHAEDLHIEKLGWAD